MALAYRAKLIYTTFAQEVHNRQQQPWTSQTPVLVGCPRCGEEYSIVEQADATRADIQRHKEFIASELRKRCPDHPEKFSPFD
jgi:hypothetical protein